MNRIFVDLEMNPMAKIFKDERRICSRETIEFGAVRLDDEAREVSSFQEYVRPQYSEKIYPRYTKITGITTEMVADADVFADVFARFVDWCGTDYEIYSWSDSDIWQLLDETRLKKVEDTQGSRYLFNHWKDFQQEYCALFELDHVLSLEKAVYLNDLDFRGQQHDGLWDARNTANLYRATLDRDRFEQIRRIVIDAMRPSETFTMGDMFNFSSFNLPAE